MIEPARILLVRRLLLAALAIVPAAPAAFAASDLLAFTRAASSRQGAFEAGGVAWTCGGELCSARGPDDVALWPGLCAAFAREAGPVAAFGSVKDRFDAKALARCNEMAAASRVAPEAPAPPAAPGPAPAPASPTPAPPAPTKRDEPAAPTLAPSAPSPPAPPATPGAPTPSFPPTPPTTPPAPGARTEAASDLPGAELCNGRDDDGDGRIDEGVRVHVWEDRDRDLFGDPLRARDVCPPELGPGLVLNDYDCDDADPKRNPSRDNCD